MIIMGWVVAVVFILCWIGIIWCVRQPSHTSTDPLFSILAVSFIGLSYIFLVVWLVISMFIIYKVL